MIYLNLTLGFNNQREICEHPGWIICRVKGHLDRTFSKFKSLLPTITSKPKETLQDLVLEFLTYFNYGKEEEMLENEVLF
jgi:hypothetical protein